MFAANKLLYCCQRTECWLKSGETVLATTSTGLTRAREVLLNAPKELLLDLPRSVLPSLALCLDKLN
jgi:hypothetical protein